MIFKIGSQSFQLKLSLKAICAFLFLFLFQSSISYAQFAKVAFFKKREASINFTTLAQSIYNYNCSGVVTVQHKNAMGVAANVTSNLTLNLSGTGSVTFYSDSACGTPVTSVVIASGSNSKSFYFMDSAVGTPTISVNATGFRAISQTETITASPYIWTGGGANAFWSTAANWSGGAAPGNTHVAIFNSSCSSNCSPVISAAIDVGGVRMVSGYTGTITQNSGIAITVQSKSWVQESGTFVGTTGTGNMTIWGSWFLAGGSFTAPRGNLIMSYQSNNFIVSNSPTFNHNSGTVILNNCSSPTITPGNITLNNLHLENSCNWSGSTLNGTLTVTGNITIASSSYQGNFGHGGTVNLSGSLTSSSNSWGIASNCYIRLVGGAGSNVTVSGNGSSLGGMEIASAGTVNFANTIQVTGDFKYTSGTFNPGTSRVNFGGGSTQAINPGALVFNDVGVTAGAYNTINYSGDVFVGRDFYLSSWDGRSGSHGGNFRVQRNVIATSDSNWGNSTITLEGSVAQTVTGSTNASFLNGNMIIKNTSGTPVALGSAITLNSSGQTLSLVTGSVNMAGYALNVKALSLNGNTITRNAGTLTVNGTVVGAGTVSAYGGTVAP